MPRRAKGLTAGQVEKETKAMAAAAEQQHQRVEVLTLTACHSGDARGRWPGPGQR
jgi:hypothetical protein